MAIDPGTLSDDDLIAAHARLDPSSMSDESLQLHHDNIQVPSTAGQIAKAVIHNLPAGNEFGALAAGAASAMSFGSTVLEKTTEPAPEQAKVLREAGNTALQTASNTTAGVPGLQAAGPFAANLAVGLGAFASSLTSQAYAVNVGMYQRVNALFAMAAEEAGINPSKSSNALIQQAAQSQKNLEPLNFWAPAGWLGEVLGYAMGGGWAGRAAETTAKTTGEKAVTGLVIPTKTAAEKAADLPFWQRAVEVGKNAGKRGIAGAGLAEIAPYRSDADTVPDERYPGTAAAVNMILGPVADRLFRAGEKVSALYGTKSAEIEKAAADTGITLTKGEKLEPGIASAMRGRPAEALKPTQQKEAYETLDKEIQSYGLPKETGEAMLKAQEATKGLLKAAEAQKTALYAQLKSKIDPTVTMDTTKPIIFGENPVPPSSELLAAFDKVTSGETYKDVVGASRKAVESLPANATYAQLQSAQIDAQHAANTMFELSKGKLPIPDDARAVVKNTAEALSDRLDAHVSKFASPEAAGAADVLHRDVVVPLRGVIKNNGLNIVTGLIAGSVRGDITRTQLSSVLQILPEETQVMTRNAIVGNVLKQAKEKASDKNGIVDIGSFVQHAGWLIDNPIAPQSTRNMLAGFGVLMNHPNLQPMIAAAHPESLAARKAAGLGAPALPQLKTQNVLDGLTSTGAAMLAALLDTPIVAKIANIAGQAYGRDNPALAAAVSTEISKIFNPQKPQDPQRGQ